MVFGKGLVQRGGWKQDGLRFSGGLFLRQVMLKGSGRCRGRVFSDKLKCESTSLLVDSGNG